MHHGIMANKYLNMHTDKNNYDKLYVSIMWASFYIIL